MGLFDKGFTPIKEAQKAADAAGKGIAIVAEQVANAVQCAANKTEQTVEDIAG